MFLPGIIRLRTKDCKKIVRLAEIRNVQKKMVLKPEGNKPLSKLDVKKLCFRV